MRGRLWHAGSASEREPTLVTGAFGQVGKRCAEILLGRGHTVIAMDLDNDTSAAAATTLAAAAHPGTLIPEFTDLTDADAVASVVRLHRPTAIVHLAAIVNPPSYRNPRSGPQSQRGRHPQPGDGGTDPARTAAVRVRFQRSRLRLTQPVPTAGTHHRRHTREPDRPVRRGQSAGRERHRRTAACPMPCSDWPRSSHPTALPRSTATIWC